VRFIALSRLASVHRQVVVYPANMQKNLDRRGGLVHSQRVLIALTNAGLSREDAYQTVQTMRCRSGRARAIPDAAQERSQGAQGAEREEIEANSTSVITQHVDTIFKRVFGKS